MPTFQYRAASSDGTIIDGTLSGRSRDAIVEQLQASGHIPIRIDATAAEKKPAKRITVRRQRISDAHVADATRELSILLRAGLPLDRSLQVLVSLHDDSPLAAVLESMRSRVKEGAALSVAAAEHGTVFSPFYVSLLRAGESGGALNVILERLAEHLERSKEMRDTLVSALIYPAILVVVALASIFILLGYVVPQFSEMFASADQLLPLSTRITIGIGEALQDYGWIAALLIAGLFMLLRWRLRRPTSLQAWHRWLLGVPMIGAIILKLEVARFSRTLSTLLQNGIPLLKALTITADTVSNKVIAAGLARVAGGLKEGQSFAVPLGEEAQFPPLAVQMIRVGEESGELQEILLQVADTYDRDTQVTIKRTLAILEPALILVLGAIIAAVIISILAAILSINELVI